jgi:hypothetical protein
LTSPAHPTAPGDHLALRLSKIAVSHHRPTRRVSISVFLVGVLDVVYVDFLVGIVC